MRLQNVFSSPAVRRVLLTVLFAALAAGMFILPAGAENTYVITDGSTVLVHTSAATDPEAVLLEAGIPLGEDDTITLTSSGENTEILIRRAQLISIYDGARLLMAGSYGETVGDLLDRQGIELGESDRIDCSLSAQTSDGMAVTITRVRLETVEIEEIIPFETTVYEDGTLSPGEEVVLTEGQSGAVCTTYSVRYENDEEVARTVIAQEVRAAAVDEIRLCGPARSLDDHNFHLAASDANDYEPAPAYTPLPDTTTSQSGGSSGSGGSASAPSTGGYGSGSLNGSTVTTSSGEVLQVKQILDCEATAYTCPGYVGTTATGTTARVGAIAVDPSFIPLGSKLYVVTNDGQYIYGYCTAEDTGGAIKGNIIDLYFNTWDECIQFGRRDCTVYVLE